ncbi:MAG: hypothetical protein WC628_05785 [Candidatus Omnitrophota bacterium]
MRKNIPAFTKKIQLPFSIKQRILALGGQAKNTICFAQGNNAVLSRIHPDLANPEDLLGFEHDVKFFLRRRPQIIAHDLHPEYSSTKYAFTLYPVPCTLYPVQHHHAHIASCMAENGLSQQKVIGVAFDGTGLGSDNKLWGGEFLICDYKKFIRAAHLKEIPLIGGAQAIKEPWRIAAAWLYLIYRDKFLNLGIDFTKKINKKSWQVLKAMYIRNFNAPLTSSMGRLFDAAASLTLAKYRVRAEAELAIELEKFAITYSSEARCHREEGKARSNLKRIASQKSLAMAPFEKFREAKPLQKFYPASTSRLHSYNFKILNSSSGCIIDPAPIFRQIVGDLKGNAPKEKIAYKFHRTAAEIIRKTCVILRIRYKIDTVVLSGGVFQNKILLALSREALTKAGFRVIEHKKISCNDSGISLGQAVIANM